MNSRSTDVVDRNGVLGLPLEAKTHSISSQALKGSDLESTDSHSKMHSFVEGTELTDS